MDAHQQWLEGRRQYLGGSDCAAVLGLSRWKTPYQLYLEKIGEAEPEPETWEMARGKALEPLLRQHYADTTGREVLLPAAEMRSDKHPFIGYNPDGITSEDRLVEFKTAAYGQGWGEEGSDEIPQEYILQVQQGMIVTGFQVCDVTVSIAGNKPKYFVVEADKELQEMIIEREYVFWHRNVQARIEPEPISNEDVARKYGFSTATQIVATEIITELLEKLRVMKQQIKSAEESKEEAEVLIKSFMGHNDTLVSAGGTVLCTWKQRKGSERIDGALLKKEQPSIAAQYTKIGEPSRTFLLK